MIGVNAGQKRSTSSILGKQKNPYGGSSALSTAIIILIMFLLFGVAVALYIKNRKDQKAKEVNFDIAPPKIKVDDDTDFKEPLNDKHEEKKENPTIQNDQTLDDQELDAENEAE